VLVVVIAGLALAPGAGAAPAKGGRLDSKRLAAQVAAAVAPAYPDLAVGAATCPKKISKKKGTVTTCDVELGGLSLQFTVTQTDRSGNVSIASTQALIPKAKAEEFVRANATLPVLADCGPDPYIVRVPGTPFWCTVRFGDGTVQQVAVSVGDLAGKVTITQVI